METKILLHCCCAVCAAGCIERLQDSGRDVTLFFSNSNIDTKEEFDKRLAEVRKLSAIYNTPLIVDSYDHQLWLDAVKGLEDLPERGRRCSHCFSFNFQRTSDLANQRGMSFTTTLSVSPHKDSLQIQNEGARFDLFEFFNFKKQEGFAKTLALAKQYHLYHQSYCGCEFSKKTSPQK